MELKDGGAKAEPTGRGAEVELQDYWLEADLGIPFTSRSWRAEDQRQFHTVGLRNWLILEEEVGEGG